MNRILIIGFLAVFISSCSKEMHLPQEVSPDETVTLNLSFTLGNSGTRAFFDDTMIPEPWEKEINSLNIVILNNNRDLIQEHSFEKVEIESMRTSLEIPYALLENGGYIYAIANAPFPAFRRNEITSLQENFCVRLNGDFNKMTNGCIRQEGFPMSAYKTLKVNKGTPTDISLELKRTVSKLAMIINVDPDVGGEFAKGFGITRVALSQLSSTSYIFEGNRFHETSYSITQKSDVVDGQYRNLFYAYESALYAKPYITLTVWLDKDGDPETTNDIHTMDIKIPLEFSGDGVIKRNNYYRVTINLKGLELADIQSVFSVMDWTDGGYEEIDYGENNN